MTEDRQKKIAVIGARGPRYEAREVRVECFPWNGLKKLTNLADYDVVILDLLSMTGQGLQDVETVESILNERSVLEVLVNRNQGGPNGAIYVLGDPRFSLTEEIDFFPVPPSPPHRGAGVSRAAEASTTQREIPFLYWTNMEFKWDDRPGDTIERMWEASAGQFKRYADKLGRWQYSLKACRLNSHVLDEFLPTDALRDLNYTLRAHVEDICSSRYSTSIVFSVRIMAEGRPSHRRAGIGTAEQAMTLTGPIYFLPESQLSEEETLEFVLRDLCGVDVSASEPEWVSQFVAPGQEEVDREIADLETRIGILHEDRARKVEERSEVRKPLKLLYETGPPLEEAVRSVLELLGAEVEWPGEDRKNKEDGWLTVRVEDQTMKGVLEVKGVKTKHFDTDGLRQLTTWIHRGISSRRERYTGIFVGNSSRQDPPRHRIWPFSKDWVEEAELHGYAAVRTEDLYVLYLLDRTGRLDRDEFWRELFSTKGPFDMRPYRGKLSAEEQEQLEGLPQT